MNNYEKSRHDRFSHKITHKGGELAMNSIKKLQNAQALSVSAENSYSEDKLMNMFLDNFHQGGTYIAHIARHQVELRREGNLTYRKYLTITFLQTDYLNLDRSSGSGRNNERENIVNTK